MFPNKRKERKPARLMVDLQRCVAILQPLTSLPVLMFVLQPLCSGLQRWFTNALPMLYPGKILQRFCSV